MHKGQTRSNHLTRAEEDAFTHVRRRSHRYGGRAAAAGTQDGASCYRSPMTLLIPSRLSLRSAPHIPPINRTACQLISPCCRYYTFHFMGPRTHWASAFSSLTHALQLPTIWLHDTWGSTSRAVRSFHLNPITHQSCHPESLKPSSTFLRQKHWAASPFFSAQTTQRLPITTLCLGKLDSSPTIPFTLLYQPSFHPHHPIS